MNEIFEEQLRGVKFFFAHSPSRTSGWTKTLALMTFSLALIYSLHHYVNVCYLFIKLERIKQVKRFWKLFVLFKFQHKHFKHQN